MNLKIILGIISVVLGGIALGYMIRMAILYGLATLIIATKSVPPGNGILFEASYSIERLSIKLTPLTISLSFALGFIIAWRLFRKYYGGLRK
ncbi:hypothetical protein PFDSM3638_05475 [Pyrococcus furiosus DSM 3638]|uniref:DUF4321 domain-containing protein n=3 Tax=Pyrococcus furiosus TaxID=2261 RepID=A0A5C0XPM9_PYRFU|nr:MULTISPECIES: hypothetical protein [Pyrococcus]AAL81217.1 hypothetical protein PF1093 [Pyrococcus furiosus DSM 3638]AFN03885.1 hypothetical protein PFC_04690 [Pyrococcus furiosus COM1]MDK2868785.1 hypothetical protein [Pyrococcus sp.]QEK78749.1 hypothetical protein PFDSM3638_05475 [Pyrococcus furiosus DSM 3638]